MVQAVAEYQLPDFELEDESQDPVGFAWHSGRDRVAFGQDHRLVQGLLDHEGGGDESGDVSLSEAAALLPSFLLPPETDISALPQPASPPPVAQPERSFDNSGALWPTCAARVHALPLSKPTEYECAESEYQVGWGYAAPDTSARQNGMEREGRDDMSLISAAMGWENPHDYTSSATHDVQHKSSWGGEHTHVNWNRGAGMGTGEAGEVEVIAAACSLKQLLALPYSDHRVSLAVHRVGETLLIDQPPPVTQPCFKAGGGCGHGTMGDVEGVMPQQRAGASSVDSFGAQDHPTALEFHPMAAAAVTSGSVGPAGLGAGESNERGGGVGGQGACGKRRGARRKKNGRKQDMESLHLQHRLYLQLSSAGHLLTGTSAQDADERGLGGGDVGDGGSIETCDAARSLMMSAPKSMDKWSDKEWAHACSSDSSDDDSEGGGHRRASQGGEADGGAGQFAPWALRMCKFQLGSLQMLLGSDVMVLDHPSSGQPCVSLYVRDPAAMSRTGFLDIWLDNVIASVPHVLMCWHKNAVIQGYMLKRTSDLPALSHFEFSPERIEQCGSQVIKWLHSSCQSEASTYWLLKERGDERLQLYNLSALHKFTSAMGAATDAASDMEQPAAATASGPGAASSVPERFRFPVAMLCIRAAARLAALVTAEARTRRRELLVRSVGLLNDDQHATLLANVHEHIAETYVSLPFDDHGQERKRDGELGENVQRGLGLSIESYPSLHADTFVLPLSDKRLDVQLALEHLSSATVALYRSMERGGGGGKGVGRVVEAPWAQAPVISALARVRRKAVECLAFLSQVCTSKRQWDTALEMLVNAFQFAQPIRGRETEGQGGEEDLQRAEALVLGRLRCLLGDALLSAAERQPTAPPTPQPPSSPDHTPAATPPPTPPRVHKDACFEAGLLRGEPYSGECAEQLSVSGTKSRFLSHPGETVPVVSLLPQPAAPVSPPCAASPPPVALPVESGERAEALGSRDGQGVTIKETGVEASPVRKGRCMADASVAPGDDTLGVGEGSRPRAGVQEGGGSMSLGDMPSLPLYPGESCLDLTLADALGRCAGHYEAARRYFALHHAYVDFVAASRRLGHVRNEMGKQAGREDADAAEAHWRAAIAIFSEINDGENLSVIMINLAKLLRGRGQRLLQQAGSLTVAARTCIAEAVNMYERAFGALRKKHDNPTAWVMVQAELANTFEDFADMLEADGAREAWRGPAAREDAQLVVDLRNRAISFLRETRAPGWRLAQAHLALGSFYHSTLHMGGGTVTRTRYDAAHGQLRKCLLLAGADHAAAQDGVSVALRPDGVAAALDGAMAGCVGLDANSENVVLRATALLSLLPRVAGLSRPQPQSQPLHSPRICCLCRCRCL